MGIFYNPLTGNWDFKGSGTGGGGGVTPIGPVTLIDNSSGTAFSTPATARKVLVSYSLTRNGQTRDGEIEVASNGSSTAYSHDFVETSDIGVTLVVVFNAGAIDFNYTTTNLGFNAALKYTLTTWS